MVTNRCGCDVMEVAIRCRRRRLCGVGLHSAMNVLQLAGYDDAGPRRELAIELGAPSSQAILSQPYHSVRSGVDRPA